MTDFKSDRNAVCEAARQEAIERDGEPRDRKERQYLSEAVNKAESEWFKTQPFYNSILVDRYEHKIEIKDDWFGGSIEVFSPQRREEWVDDESVNNKKVSIIPGYINASTWHAGRGLGSDVPSVKQEMLHRLRMMEMALMELNKVNSVIVEWESIENPFTLKEWEKDELKHFREQQKIGIQRALDKSNKKKGGK